MVDGSPTWKGRTVSIQLRRKDLTLTRKLT